MGKFEGILFCSDIDGTLCLEDGSISRENVEAIEHFTREGGLFSIATGRMPSFTETYYVRSGSNAPTVCVNGGGIYDFSRREYLRTLPLQESAVELAAHVMRRVEGVSVQANTFDLVYFCSVNESTERFVRLTGLPLLRRDLLDVKEPIAKIVFTDLREEAILAVKETLAAHPLAKDFDFVRSERMIYEILPKGASKGAALLHLAEMLGVDRQRTLAIGDYDNDLSMIRAAGVGIAVGDAVDALKREADLVTVTNREHAIAAVIHALDRGEILPLTQN